MAHARSFVRSQLVSGQPGSRQMIDAITNLRLHHNLLWKWNGKVETPTTAKKPWCTHMFQLSGDEKLLRSTRELQIEGVEV